MKEFKQRPGMRQELRGILNHPVNHFASSEKLGYSHVTKTLMKNLQELGDRYYSGDESVVDEFLQLYDLDQKRKEPNQ